MAQRRQTFQAQINVKGRCVYIAQVSSEEARDVFKRIGELVREVPGLTRENAAEYTKTYAERLKAAYKNERERLTKEVGWTQEQIDIEAAHRVVEAFETDQAGALAPVSSPAPGPAAEPAQLLPLVEPFAFEALGEPAQPLMPDPFGAAAAAGPAQLVPQVSGESCSEEVVSRQASKPLVWIWQLCDQPLDVGRADTSAETRILLDDLRRSVCDDINQWLAGLDLPTIDQERIIAKCAFHIECSSLPMPSYKILAKSFGPDYDNAWLHFLRLKVATRAGLLRVSDEEYQSRVSIRLFTEPGCEHYCCVQPNEGIYALQLMLAHDDFPAVEGSSGGATNAQPTQPSCPPVDVARPRVKVALMVENDDYLAYTRDELPKLASHLAGIWNEGAFSVDVLVCNSMDPDSTNAALTVAIGLPAADEGPWHKGPLVNIATALRPSIRTRIQKCLHRPVSEAELEVLYHCEGCVLVLLEMPALMARVLTALVELGHRQMVDKLKVSCAALIEGDHLGPLAVATFFGGGPDKAMRARKKEELVGAWHKWTQAQAAADAGKNARVGGEAAGQAAGTDGMSAAAGAAPAVCAAGEALAEAPIAASSSAALGVAAGDAVAGSKAPQAGGGFAGAKPAGSKALRRAELGQAQAGDKGPKQAPSSSATPFSVFRTEQFPALKRSNPGMTAAQLNERLGADWLSMPDSDKVYYRDKAKEAK